MPARVRAGPMPADVHIRSVRYILLYDISCFVRWKLVRCILNQVPLQERHRDFGRAATYRRTGEIPPSPTLLYPHVRESDRTWHRYQPVVGNPIRD